MNSIETAILEERIDYDGTQLHSHFAFETANILGNYVVAFFGACNVQGKNLVDLVDAAAQESIIAKEMLHIIVEVFDNHLDCAVYRQRLLTAVIKELLMSHKPITVDRRGDNLYIDERKLTVSIATISPISSLIHFGINIDPEGAPVPAIGLNELGIDARAFTYDLLSHFAQELESIERAMVKVRAVF